MGSWMFQARPNARFADYGALLACMPSQVVGTFAQQPILPVKTRPPPQVGLWCLQE